MTQGQSQVNLLTIRQFAEVCRTTPRTLRFYEKNGLFKPTVTDSFNKYRFYHPRQARDFLKIKLLQNFHIPLKQIKTNSVQATLLNRLKTLKEDIQEKEKEYKFLEKTKSFLFKDDKIENVFRTKNIGPFNLFVMKVEHGEYARIPEYIKILWKEAKGLKLKCENYEIVFYLNSAYSPKNTPLETALVLRGSTPGVDARKLSENFYFKEYPKTKALAFEYNGHYKYLILIYQKLFSYLEAEKISLKSPGFDIYKYGPLNTVSQYDYQTMIGFPI